MPRMKSTSVGSQAADLSDPQAGERAQEYPGPVPRLQGLVEAPYLPCGGHVGPLPALGWAGAPGEPENAPQGHRGPHRCRAGPSASEAQRCSCRPTPQPLASPASLDLRGPDAVEASVTELGFDLGDWARAAVPCSACGWHRRPAIVAPLADGCLGCLRRHPAPCLEFRGLLIEPALRVPFQGEAPQVFFPLVSR